MMCVRACVRVCVRHKRVSVRTCTRVSRATPPVHPLRKLSRVNYHDVNPVAVLKKKQGTEQMVRWKLMMG